MSVQFLRRDEKIVEDEGMLQNGPSNESTVFRKLKISRLIRLNERNIKRFNHDAVHPSNC